jgi:tetratricopeptide (TPR) repeat protein
MKKMRKVLLLLVIGLYISSVCAQSGNRKQPKGDPVKAMEMYKTGNFYGAIVELERLVVSEPSNLTYKALLGFAYLNTNIDKTKAIPFFEEVVKDAKSDYYSHYDLGRAYMMDYRFDDAIAQFKLFSSKLKGSEKDLPIPAPRIIEMCEYAKIAHKNPANVTIQNLGPEINTEYPDYSAFVDESESILLYTSRRKGNTGNFQDVDGLLTADVFMSTSWEDVWQKSRRMTSAVNTYLIEESVGMTADGQDLLIYVYSENGMDDIFISSKKGRQYAKAEFLPVNSKYEETSAAMSPDKRYIILASKRPGGLGGIDLYLSKKLPNDSWSEPRNLGPTINTEFDDDFPSFSPCGTKLYFASKGHKGMGGYDIFKTDVDLANMTFSAPENMGFPINTPDDNKTISFTRSGRYAYIADLRKDGVGNLDIYKVIFHDIPAPYIAYAGNVFDKDSVDIYEAQRQGIEKTKAQLARLESNISTEEKNIQQMRVKINEVAKDTSALAMQKRTAYERSIVTSENRISQIKEVEIPNAKKTLEELQSEIVLKINLLDPKTKKVLSVFTPHILTGEFAVIAQPGKYIVSVVSNKFKNWETEFEIPEREPAIDPYKFDIHIEKEAPKRK